MVYKKIILVKHPVNEGKFLVGVDAYTNFFATLDNERAVNIRTLCFVKSMNPWTIHGESLDVISDYYLGRPNKYYGTGGQPRSVTGVFTSHMKMTHKGIRCNPRNEHITFSSIRKDFIDACKEPIMLDDDARFTVSEKVSVCWSDIMALSEVFNHTRLLNFSLRSLKYVVDDKAYKGMTRPYYVIKVYSGKPEYIYWEKQPYSARTTFLSQAKQFDSEKHAFQYIETNAGEVEAGFEVLEIPPPKEIPILLRTR